MPLIPFAAWERAQGQGSRSTVLRPLGWLLALCATSAITSASIANTPTWLTILFGIATGLSVAMYLVAYAYCLIKSPDTLRTERYSILKLAIEKGFRGDSTTGIVMATETGATRLLESSSEEQARKESE